LLHNPRAGRVFRDIEMKDFASVVFDYEKAVQHAKCQSRHSEEVHGRDGLAVIAKESRPEPAGVERRRQAPEIAGHRAFRDVKARFQKFPMNSGSAPA
jgi:hypothetical protein